VLRSHSAAECECRLYFHEHTFYLQGQPSFSSNIRAQHRINLSVAGISRHQAPMNTTAGHNGPLRESCVLCSELKLTKIASGFTDE